MLSLTLGLTVMLAGSILLSHNTWDVHPLTDLMCFFILPCCRPIRKSCFWLGHIVIATETCFKKPLHSSWCLHDTCTISRFSSFIVMSQFIISRWQCIGTSIARFYTHVQSNLIWIWTNSLLFIVLFTFSYILMF